MLFFKESCSCGSKFKGPIINEAKLDEFRQIHRNCQVTPEMIGALQIRLDALEGPVSMQEGQLQQIEVMIERLNAQQVENTNSVQALISVADGGVSLDEVVGDALLDAMKELEELPPPTPTDDGPIARMRR